jgi:hypothetical protein
MVLSLVQLTDFEKEAIGQSIVGLEKPDLSMFPIGERDEILNKSIEYLIETLERGYGTQDVAKKITSMTELIVESPVKHSLRWDIMKAAEDLSDNAGQDILFAYFDKDKLLEKAERQIRNPKEIHLVSGLDYILNLHKLAGENLDKKNIQKIALELLYEGKMHSTRVVQVYKKFNEIGATPRLNKSHLTEIIRACESQYHHIFNEQKIEGDELTGKAIGSVLPFTRSKNSVNRIKDSLDIAEKAASINCFNVMYGVASRALDIIGKEKPLSKKVYAPRLEAIADKLNQGGFFGYSKHLLVKLGKDFDNEKAFSIFIETIRTGNAKCFQYTPMVQYLLGDVSNQQLKDFADRTYDLIKADKFFTRPNGSLYAYIFVINAYKKLNEAQLAAEAEQAQKGWNEQRMLSLVRKRTHHAPKEQEVIIPQKNLGDALLEMEGFIDDVVKAYDKKGVGAVQKVIQEYGSRLTEKDFTHAYGGHAVEILGHALHKKGRKFYTEGVLGEPTDGFALKNIEYILLNGTTPGEGYASYHKVRDKENLAKRTKPVDWALGAAVALLENYKNKDEALEAAEIAAKLGKTSVPPILYRIAAAEDLRWITRQPRSWDGKFEIDIGGAYTAGELYKKVGDKGLIAFVENNFLKDVNLKSA